MPGDTKPHKARAAKKKHASLRKTGSIADMQREVWRAILCARDIMLDIDSDAATTLKAVHAITSASSAYAKLVEVGELESRLSELEQSLEKRKNGRVYA